MASLPLSVASADSRRMLVQQQEMASTSVEEIALGSRGAGGKDRCLCLSGRHAKRKLGV